MAFVAEATSPPPTEPLANLPENARSVLLVVSLLAITLIINNLVEKRNLPIPEAIVTVVIGVIAGGAISLAPGKAGKIEQLEDQSATEFMVAFIAPIIFAEGYGLKSHQFFENIIRILTHAFLGTLISSIVVAVGLFYMSPLTGLAAEYDISFAECLTFGALISSTDPVTTLAIFKEQSMVENGLSYLYYTVLGESILNDAVAITLFSSFGQLVMNDQDLDVGSALSMAKIFFITFIGSTAIGVACGMASALVLKLTRLQASDSEEQHFYFNVPEIGVALVFAYSPFLIAEACDLSGIVAAMFAGIAMRHYAHYNLTLVTRQVFLPTIELIATLCETYVFLLLGLGVFLLSNNYSLSVILWAALFCMVGRAVHVYPFSWLINRCSSAHDLNLREQHVVWYAGLRGAIAFVCVLGFPESKANPQPKHRGLFLCTTVVLVGATLLFLGWPTTAVLRCLDIKARESALPELGMQRRVSDEAATQRTPFSMGSAHSSWRDRLRSTQWNIAIAVKKALLTSDALVEREATQQMASQLRSQRLSGGLSAMPRLSSPRLTPGFSEGPLQALNLPADASADGTPAGSMATSARPSSAAQHGLPLQGRTSAPVTSLREQAAPLVGRPSAPAGLLNSHGASGRRIPLRSGRSICNP